MTKKIKKTKKCQEMQMSPTFQFKLTLLKRCSEFLKKNWNSKRDKNISEIYYLYDTSTK